MEKHNNVTLTIFTPAYNRAHTITRTYESLCRQSNKDFMWMIIDDGSVDNTADIVKEFQKQDNGFEIQYIYKENGGMHTAHNTAYANITTELNTCIDSDDALSNEAVQKILSKWNEVKDKGYSGIVALDANMQTGEVIGKSFDDNLKETTLREYYSTGGEGDKKLIYRTDLICQTPDYPVFEGEKYVSLAYKYRLLDEKYKLAVLNEVVCDVDYQETGSSNNMFRQYLNNPKGFAFIRVMDMKNPTSNKRLIVDCIHYCSSSFISKNKNYIKESPKKFLTILCSPIGLLFTMYIKKSVKKMNHSWDQSK